MRAIFPGVGEAFDERVPNCCLVLERETAPESPPERLLLDCGFTAAHAYWRSVPEPTALAGVALTHLHGDHFFGLPLLLLRFREHGRTAPLTILGGPGTQEAVLRAVDLAYGGLSKKLDYELVFVESVPGREISLGGFSLSGALSEHSQPNTSLLVAADGVRCFYSGDGRPTQATRELAQGAELVVQEAFGLEEDMPGHGSVPGAIAFGEAVGAGGLALVHLRREVRHGRREEVENLLRQARRSGLQTFLPEPGDSFVF